MYDNHLEHHGILGQRWGVRRFQNKDGSLTSAGKKRYDTGEANNDKKAHEKLNNSVDKVKTIYSNHKKAINRGIAVGATVAASKSALETAHDIYNELIENNGKVSVKNYVVKGTVNAGKRAVVGALGGGLESLTIDVITKKAFNRSIFL